MADHSASDGRIPLYRLLTNSRGRASGERRVRISRIAGWPKRRLYIIGENGLLKQLTKAILERALTAEMSDHLGYEKHDPAATTGAASG